MLVGLAAAALLAGVQQHGHAGVGRAPDCTRPYTDASPWNTPIPAGAAYEADSAARINAIGGNLSSDPTQYTYPVYYATASTPKSPVTLSGAFSRLGADGNSFSNTSRTTVQAPVPAAAAPASGSDAQIIVIDLSTGDEWGFYNFGTAGGGGYQAVNGYRYNVGANGAPAPSGADGFVARGAGVPYLAGLVRPCEIQRGSIEHALAFAYDAPGGDYVFPATKSDGAGSGPGALPEGARLQLDPALTDAQIAAWGCSGACLTIAHALQRYGMYVVDNSGSSKIMMEFDGTAGWNSLVSRGTAASIPLSAFRLLGLSTGAGTPPPPGSGTSPGGSAPPAPAGGAAGSGNETAEKAAAKKKKRVKRSSKGSKRLAVARYHVRGRNLRAGRAFVAQATFSARSRSGRVPGRMRPRCPARIGSRTVPLVSAKLVRTANGKRVRTSCRWAIPRGTRGKRLRASVTVGYAGGETRIRFVGRIRKAR